ncbi:MAG: hypothetical protein ACLFVU_05025 [Phycisphaerae bacterium]
MSQMTTMGGPAVEEVKPTANVYTVLVFVAILAIGFTAGYLAWQLTAPVAEGGYGLEFGQLFAPLTEIGQSN